MIGFWVTGVSLFSVGLVAATTSLALTADLLEPCGVDLGATSAAASSPGMSTYSAVVLGSTGAVGCHVVKQLVQSPRCLSLTAVVRRTGAPADLFGVSSDKIRVAVVDFDSLNRDQFQGFDVAFSCIGTTRRQAGSGEAFKKVDLDYVVNTARMLAEAGTKQMLVVTAANSNPDSWFLYPQVKGIAERRLAQLRFHRLVIVRPAFLIRDQTDRWVEKIGLSITPGFIQVHVAQVAKAMVTLAEEFDAQVSPAPTVDYIEHARIKSIAAKTSSL